MDGPGPAAGAPSPSAASSAQVVRQAAVAFAKQAEKLSLKPLTEDSSPVAIKARFFTQHDPVIIASDGSRLPGVPLQEAHKLNILGETLQSRIATAESPDTTDNGGLDQGTAKKTQRQNGKSPQKSTEGTLQQAMPPSHTNPLFPPLPLYGPPSMLRNVQCLVFRFSSFFLSLAFLGFIVIGALFCKATEIVRKLMYRLTLRNIDQLQPFFEEEKRRAHTRRQRRKSWERRVSSKRLGEDQVEDADAYPPTEGGKDPIVCDVGYYARRVGLNVETFHVQTEDDFIITLWHVYDPKEYTSRLEQERGPCGPTATASPASEKHPQATAKRRRFPVLLMHGLLKAQAPTVATTTTLSFWLCKSGFDVWLGNNRCGFTPKHKTLEYGDPRMWCWNIRQMGVFDLPALTGRVLFETGFKKMGLICHSQGTAETFIALAKEQRPELGDRLTVFCALAPAAYAGPLIGKIHFKFMRIISPAMFRMIFGVHSFIPLMMQMHALIPVRIYGWLGYTVFSFLFDWSDQRWDRELRDRMFQFAPVYVSAESMRWWLGRECFAKHKCILATREASKSEEAIDEMGGKPNDDDSDADDKNEEGGSGGEDEQTNAAPTRNGTAASAWYDSRAPPFALWVCGKDDLVDGQRLLRRFDRGHEPHVRVVHSKVLDGYEHLDVIWAMDAVDQVFCEIRDVLWKTWDVRDACRVPVGCEAVTA